MFGRTFLKKISTVTLFFFLWFSVTTDFVFPQEQRDESDFTQVEARVQEYIDEGDIDLACETLENFIEEEIESAAVKKENVAKACCWLARLYFKLEENEERIDRYLRILVQIDPEYRLNTDYEVDEEFRKKFDAIKKAEIGKKIDELENMIVKIGGKRKKKKCTFWKISAGAGVLLAGVALYFLLKCKSKEDLSLSITTPVDGETVCYEGFNPDGESVIAVRGTKSGRDLESPEKIVVLVKESGGSIWWVSGEIISAAEANTGTWQMQNVSIGKPSDPNTQYKITAVVTTVSLSSGQNLTELPNHKASSDVIMITRGGPCQ